MSSRHWNRRHVLVTGGTGFGGSHLVRRLLENGAEVSVIDLQPPVSADRERDRECARYVEADIRYQSSFQRVLDEDHIDTVFHLAAQPIVPRSLRDPAETWSINLQGTLSVLEAMRRSKGARRLVFASSGAVYGSLSENQPIAEDHAPGPIGHAYAASKIAAEAAVQSHGAAYGLKVVCCRFMNTYGPGDRHRSRLIPGAIQRLIDKQPYDFGERDDGSTELDFVHVDDMARAYLAAGEKLDDPRVDGSAINFGSESPRRIRDVATAVSRAFGGTEREPVFRGPHREHSLRKSLDIGRARKWLGWSPKIDFDEGLAATVVWSRQRAGYAPPASNAERAAPEPAKSPDASAPSPASAAPAARI